MNQRTTPPIAMNELSVSPVRRYFAYVYAKLSDFCTRAEQRIDQLYKENIFTASTVLPLFSVTLTSTMRYFNDDSSKFSCPANAFGTPLFFCELLVMAAGSAHVLTSVVTLFIKLFYKGIALRARVAESQVFLVLGAMLIALILANASCVIYYLIDYDFNTFEAPNTHERFRAFVFFTSATFHVFVCYNRLLAFYSMPRLFTASWTLLIILIVCGSGILDYVRGLTPEGPTKTFLTVVLIGIRVIAIIWTFWRNLTCFLILAQHRNWRRMTTLVKMARWLCGWMPLCIPAMNYDTKDEDLFGRGIGGIGERTKNKGKSKYGEIGNGGESDEEIHPASAPAISPDDAIALKLATVTFGDTLVGGPNSFGLDDLNNPGTAETDWGSNTASGMVLEQLAELPEDDDNLSDISPSGSHNVRVSVVSSDSQSDVGKDMSKLQDISPQDGLALTVAFISTFNLFFVAYFFPQGMEASESGSSEYTLCDRVNINVIYSFYMLIIQHRLSLVYIHEVDLNFLTYHRNFRNVSKDLGLLLGNLLPEDIKGRMMERMSVVLQGDSSAEDALPPLSQCSEECEAERATERHIDDIEISCSDISLISQMQSSVFGVCMASDLVKPKITSDKIVFRFNASLLEKVKLTI